MAQTSTSMLLQNAGKNSSASSGPKTDSQSVTKRLQSELMQLMMSSPKGVSAFPDGDNIFYWVATVTGVDGTVYEGLEYKLSLTFTQSYPFTAPEVRFTTPCYHPNVDQYGNICLDILKEVNTLNFQQTHQPIEPNNDSPLNGYAAAQWDNQEEFKATLLRKYKEATGRSME